MRWYQPGGDYSRDYWLINDSDEIIARIRHNFEGTWTFGIREFLSEEGAKKAAMRANGATLKEILEQFPKEKPDSPQYGVWIEWNGDDKSPIPEGSKYMLRFRDGEAYTYADCRRGFLRWGHIGSDGDIVAYKILP